MIVEIRPFEKIDIVKKVEWVNNRENNRFLHYDIPIEISKTEQWFDNNQGRSDRFDAIILADGMPCGTAGLLEIDRRNAKAEYYILIGETRFKGKGVSAEASKMILQYAFQKIHLNKVYLYTEVENISAQKLFEKVGFLKEGCLRADIFSKGKFVDRYIYGICKENFENICV